MIPEFPSSKPIELSDKPFYDKHLEKMNPVNSEFTFTNLFLWGRARKYTASILEKHIIVAYEKEKKKYFFTPIGKEPESIIGLVTGRFPEAEFVRVPEGTAAVLDKSAFSIEEDRVNFDYVYRRYDLAELKGDRYSPKRSFVKRALAYNPNIIEDADIDVSKCRALQDRWCDLRKCEEDASLLAEAKALSLLFEHRKELAVKCVAIELSGEHIAFSVGEPLNKETFVVHFEKADPAYTGMYQLVNHEFAKRIPEIFQFINREQDLGIEGMRKAKESYHPAFMVKKYTVKKK